jgi:undecaprenyl-diphosphatase
MTEPQSRSPRAPHSLNTGSDHDCRPGWALAGGLLVGVISLFVFGAVTTIGSPVTVAVIGVCVAVALLVQRRRTLLAGWTIALGGAGLLNETLKAVVHRARPPHAALTLHHLSFSFPSGHAMGSTVGYGMLAYLLLLACRGRTVRVMVIVLATMLILLIGISRLYLGVHYLTDVLGGYAAGGAWLSACVTGTDIARRRATG